jgi:hypothetical protein
MNFITGEKIQNDCDLFIASPDMLNYNPNITINHPKSFNLYNLNSEIDNPKFIYTSSDDLYLFKEKLVFFKNPFVLISHNSDKIIFNNDIYNYIANHNKIIKWYTQNLLFNHPKVFMIPIGIANSQWQHGNLNYISNALNYIENKTNNIYFNFFIITNVNKREECFLKLKDFLEISEKKPPRDYFNYLASFKFAICPQGNGIDSHRIWECYYLKVIPIVIDNLFIRKIKSKYNLPMIILQDWEELRNIKLEYKDFDNSILDYSVLKNEIFS